MRLDKIITTMKYHTITTRILVPALLSLVAPPTHSRSTDRQPLYVVEYPTPVDQYGVVGKVPTYIPSYQHRGGHVGPSYPMAGEGVPSYHMAGHQALSKQMGGRRIPSVPMGGVLGVAKDKVI